jgi:hypothetical protein
MQGKERKRGRERQFSLSVSLSLSLEWVGFNIGAAVIHQKRKFRQ